MAYPYYIECTGVPGSGKTEAAHILKEQLEARGCDATVRAPLRDTFLQKVFLIVKLCVFIVRRPYVLRLWLFPLDSSFRRMPHVRAVIRNVRWRFVLDTVIVRAMLVRTSCLINDEGFIGKLVVLSLLTNIPEKNMRTLLHAVLPEPVTMVHLNTPTDVAIARAKERSVALPFFDAMDTSVRKRFYDQNAERYERVAALLDEQHGATVFRITNVSSAEALRGEIEGVTRLLCGDENKKG